MPQINSQRVIPLNEDESIIFNVKNHTITYKESSGKQLPRTALELGIFQDPMFGTFSNLTIEENMSIAFKRGLRLNNWFRLPSFDLLTLEESNHCIH